MKRRPACADRLSLTVARRRSRRFGLALGDLHRARILARGRGVAIDEPHHRNRGAVAVAVTGLEDAQRPALAVLVARPDDAEELTHLVLVADLRDRLAAGVQIAALAQRHELLDDRPELLGLGQRGHDLLV